MLGEDSLIWWAMKTRMFICILLLSAAGCLATNSVHIGPPQSAKSEGCPIALERLRLEQTLRSYEQVGAICANVAEEAVYRYRYIRRGVEKEACSLGGEMITIIGTCAVGELSGIEFGVFRRRATAAAGKGLR